MEKIPFWQDNALLPQRLKLTFFDIFWGGWRISKEDLEQRKNFKNVDFVFEVIVHLPKHTLGCCTITYLKDYNQRFLKNFLHSRFPLLCLPLKKKFKTIDFSLWGKQCIVSWKWIFPRVLAHCELCDVAKVCSENSPISTFDLCKRMLTTSSHLSLPIDNNNNCKFYTSRI